MSIESATHYERFRIRAFCHPIKIVTRLYQNILLVTWFIFG